MTRLALAILDTFADIAKAVAIAACEAVDRRYTAWANDSAEDEQRKAVQ